MRLEVLAHGAHLAVIERADEVTALIEPRAGRDRRGPPPHAIYAGVPAANRALAIADEVISGPPPAS